MRSQLALAGLLMACADPQVIELPPLPPPRDSGPRSVSIPDGAVRCELDSDCADDVECTRDVCLPEGYCIHAGDLSFCNDGVFCNGQEVCDHEVGCLPSSPPRCDDENVCTIDACDEASKRCTHGPRDFDQDGEADWHCSGGTDCDDFDATVASALAEICGDGVDNDCDDQVDELFGCGRPVHDRCEDALDVSAGGRFVVGLLGAAPDYRLACSDPSVRDVAVVFETATARDVTLIASGVLSDGTEETAAVGLRSRCADAGTELDCARGFPGYLRIRALPKGRYFAIISSQLSAQIIVDVRFDEPTEAPGNTTCDSPLDLSAGGRFEGDLVDVGDEESVACGFSGANDLMYVFTTTEEHDVEISALSTTGERMNFAVRTTCDDPLTTLRCASDAPARARLHRLAPGTYYVVLESSPSREVDFQLDIAFVDPTPPPPGDGCGNPIELALDTEVSGALGNRQDLVNVVCGCAEESPGQDCGLYLPDVVYRVVLDAPSDLGVHLDGGMFTMAYDVRAVCDMASSQLACAGGKLLNGRVRDLAAGEHFLIIESPQPAGYTLLAERLPRSVPQVVSANDNCTQAVVVPEAGGLYQGDTLNMLNNYETGSCGGGARSKDAVYRLDLTQPASVSVMLEATFDTVLYRFADMGLGAGDCVSGAESVCNDDGGQGNTNSLLVETLSPGSYYYVIDGFNFSNEGRYALEITVTP